jgi:hypothetical protein
MAEEQAADDLARARDHGHGEVAAHGQVAAGHALVRRVLRIARIREDVVRADHALAAKSGREDRGGARHAEVLEGGAVGARERIEHVALAGIVEHVVEEGAEARAREFHAGIDHVLHQLLQIELGGDLRAGAVDDLQRLRLHREPVAAVAQPRLDACALGRVPGALGGQLGQLDLVRCPRPGRGLVQVEDGPQRTRAQQRHHDQRARADALPGVGIRAARARIGAEVRDDQRAAGLELGHHLGAEAVEHARFAREAGHGAGAPVARHGHVLLRGIDHAITRAPHREMAAQQFGGGAGHGHRIGEVAHRVAELEQEALALLHRFALRDVAVEDREPVARGIGAHLDPGAAAAGPGVEVLDLDAPALAHCLAVEPAEGAVERARPGVPQGAAEDLLARARLQPHALGIDGQHAVLGIDQHEALGHALEHAAGARLALAQRGLGMHALGGLDDDRQHAGGAAALVEHRGVVEVHPHRLGFAVAVQHQLLVLEGQGAAGQADLHHVVVEVRHLGPALAHLGAQQLRMTAAREHRVGVVVDHEAGLAPQHHDRHRRAQQQAGRGPQALRPGGDRPERGALPGEVAHQAAQFAAALEEGQVRVFSFVVRSLRVAGTVHHCLCLSWASRRLAGRKCRQI